MVPAMILVLKPTADPVQGQSQRPRRCRLNSIETDHRPLLKFPFIHLDKNCSSRGEIMWATSEQYAKGQRTMMNWYVLFEYMFTNSYTHARTHTNTHKDRYNIYIYNYIYMYINNIYIC